MKRLLSAVVTSLLVVSCMTFPALASNPSIPTEGSITINNTEAGKKYDIYRIFDLSLSIKADDSKNYAYTINPKFTDFFAGLTPPITSDAAAVQYVSDMVEDSVETTAFAEAAKAYALPLDKANQLSGVKYSAVATGTTVVFSNVALGYYLVYPEGTSNGLCNLTSTDPDAEMILKGDYPTIDKNIIVGQIYPLDIDPPPMDLIGPQPLRLKFKGNSYTVGDRVNYELTSSVPDMTGYNDYFYTITDTMSKGLTFDEDSLVVMVGSDTLVKDTDYTLTVTTDAFDNSLIKIVFNDFYSYNNRKGDLISVIYSAILNDDAVTGAVGNLNHVTVTYSNDPNHDYTGVGDEPEEETPGSDNKVYTFKLDATKLDGNDVSLKLEDAEFSLWTTTDNGSTVTKVYDENTLYLVTDTLVSDENGKFSHKIGTGQYFLFEDKAPAGYNLMIDPLVFNVDADITEDGRLTNLMVDNPDITADVTSGTLSVNIANNSGTLLPGTGGVGTKAFMMVGGLLLAGSAAGIVLFN
ncbi:MAG: SpaH/EbpB family LPXTG-anchored major pilin, partial [Clostridiales bacterium]|nr:SpaH/EbpB family LPXTG-anchored major pilin [Clostridiales bacterium]